MPVVHTIKKKTFYWPLSGNKAYVVSFSKWGPSPFPYEVEEDKLYDFHKSYFRDHASAKAYFDALCDYLSWVTEPKGEQEQ